MRNYSIYTLKTKLEFTNLYQYLSEKDYNNLSNRYYVIPITPPSAHGMVLSLMV